MPRAFPPAVPVPVLSDAEWWRGQAELVTGRWPLAALDQVTYDRWRRRQGQTTRAVTMMTSPECDAYVRDLWMQCGAPALVACGAAHVACCHYDAAVHLGVPAATALLDAVGAGGPLPSAIAAAVAQHGEAPVVYRYLQAYARACPTAAPRCAQLRQAHLGPDWEDR